MRHSEVPRWDSRIHLPPPGLREHPKEEIERAQESEDVGECFQMLPSRYDTAIYTVS